MPDEPTADDAATADVDATDAPTSDAPLGEAGEKALAEWKRRAKAAEADAKRAAQLEAELAQLREAQMSDQEKAIEQARREAAETSRSEVLGSVNRRLFAAELKAAASGKVVDNDLLADPDVAMKLLGLDAIPVTESGDIDAGAISAALGTFIEQRPYLAASATPPPGIDQGPRQETPGAASIDEQIVDAERKGDWKTAGRLKTQQMLAR